MTRYTFVKASDLARAFNERLELSLEALFLNPLVGPITSLNAVHRLEHGCTRSLMRLRPLGLDRQASFGITSSVDDAKPGANTLQSCSLALNVDQI